MPVIVLLCMFVTDVGLKHHGDLYTTCMTLTNLAARFNFGCSALFCSAVSGSTSTSSTQGCNSSAVNTIDGYSVYVLYSLHCKSTRNTCHMLLAKIRVCVAATDV